MKSASDSDWGDQRRKILGLGDTSVHKSHYASLRQRLSELEKAELRILKLNRLYQVITQVSKAIVKTHTREDLFWEVCRLCVDCGRFQLAWIATANAAGVFTPIAWAGDDPLFIPNCDSTGSSCAIAMQTGRSQFCNDLGDQEDGCQMQAIRRGYRSFCAVPFRLPENQTGTLTLYSGESSFFDDEEIRLLEDVASDISFACEAMEREEQRQRAEQVLRETHHHLQTLFEASPVAIVAMDAEGVVTAWNRAAEELFGWSRQEAIGSPNPILPQSGASDFPELRSKLVRGALQSAMESRLRRKDGSWADVSVSVAPLRNADGRVTGCIANYVDVSERKRLETQLIQAQKMETIGRLAGGVAHDFNNLLTVVNGHADLLMQRLSHEKKLAAHAGDIRKAGQQAAELTRQLLAFSRTQMLQPQVVSLGCIVSDLESILFRLLREDIQLTVSVESGTACVNADPGQLRQVILNLVVNARDAVPAGGKITIRTETVRVDSKSEHVAGLDFGEYVTLAVSDNGIGMDKETQSRIFEPFFTTKKENQGTGLGLATVWGVVKQSGGHVRVLSEVNCGTTFIVYLPRVDGVPAAEEETETCPAPEGSETILLVEDRNDVRHLTAEILKGFGYSILQAANGDEALSVCRNSGDIGLVITDVMMPGMTGPELAAHIHRSHPQTKVLFVTGYASDTVLNEDNLEHSSGFLQKPYSAIELGNTVRQVLAGSEKKIA